MKSNSTYLHELSNVTRSTDSIGVTNQLTEMTITHGVPEWAEILDTADMPHDYFITFAALISTGFSLIMPFFATRFLITHIAELIIDPVSAAFIVDHYLPALEQGIVGLQVPFALQKELVYRFVGLLMKILYAFLWQEFFIPLPFLYNPVILHLGAGFMPLWNEVADRIAGTTNSDANVRMARNVYPGDAACRAYSPHALWHEQSANGLLDIVYVGDFMNSIIEQSLAGERDLDAFDM